MKTVSVMIIPLINGNIFRRLPEGDEYGKVGFLHGDEFNYVESMRTDEEEYQYGVMGDVVYAISPPYFLFDTSMGGTSRNGMLFLFKFDKDDIRLLDIISNGVAKKWQMEIMFNNTQDSLKILKFPAEGKIRDVGNGNLEIEVLISAAFHFDPSFKLFFDIREDKLHLNRSPDLYDPLFEVEKQDVDDTKAHSDAYYVYGFLAKKIGLETIKEALKDDYERRWIADVLSEIDNWDVSFHNVEKFTMKKFSWGEYR
jgi:hypothetical protein